MPDMSLSATIVFGQYTYSAGIGNWHWNWFRYTYDSPEGNSRCVIQWLGPFRITVTTRGIWIASEEPN